MRKPRSVLGGEAKCLFFNRAKIHQAEAPKASSLPVRASDSTCASCYQYAAIHSYHRVGKAVVKRVKGTDCLNLAAT